MAKGMNPFSLGDPDVATPILERAGLGDVRFEDVHEPMFFGSDVAEALEWVTGFSDVSDVLSSLDPDARDRALQRLRKVLAAHHGDDRGVVFPSRAWLVSARAALSAQ
jgi:hypothetical protein